MWCSRSGERCSDRGGARRILNTGTEAAISEWRRAFALGFCAQLVFYCGMRRAPQCCAMRECGAGNNSWRNKLLFMLFMQLARSTLVDP